MAVFVSTTSGNGPNPAHSHTDCANFEDGYELDQCMAMKGGVDQVVIKAIVLVILFQVSYGLPLVESGYEEGSFCQTKTLLRERRPLRGSTTFKLQFGGNSGKIPSESP